MRLLWFTAGFLLGVVTAALGLLWLMMIPDEGIEAQVVRW